MWSDLRSGNIWSKLKFRQKFPCSFFRAGCERLNNRSPFVNTCEAMYWLSNLTFIFFELLTTEWKPLGSAKQQSGNLGFSEYIYYRASRSWIYHKKNSLLTCQKKNNNKLALTSLTSLLLFSFSASFPSGHSYSKIFFIVWTAIHLQQYLPQFSAAVFTTFFGSSIYHIFRKQYLPHSSAAVFPTFSWSSIYHILR